MNLINKLKTRKMSQDGKVLYYLKRHSAYNYELSRIALRYGACIRRLRQEGHNIVTTQESAGVFRYTLKD